MINFEGANQEIPVNIASEISNVSKIINGWSTGVDFDICGILGDKFFDLASFGVELVIMFLGFSTS